MKPPRIDVISSHGQKINWNFDEFMNGGHKNGKRNQKKNRFVLRPPDGAGTADRACADPGAAEKQVKPIPRRSWCRGILLYTFVNFSENRFQRFQFCICEGTYHLD